MQKRKPQGCFRANIPRPWRYKGGSKEAGKRYREKNSEKLKIKKREEYQRNKAKHRDAKTHFENLNKKLEEAKSKDRYYFKFLSDDGSDIAEFFQSIKDNKYKFWKSTLMNQLEK